MNLFNKQKRGAGIGIAPPVFRFRRFCRKAYAVFNSLHRQVTIGHLASYIADRQLRKSVAVAIVACFMPQMLYAQEEDTSDVTQLPLMRITAPAATPQISADPAQVISAQELERHAVRSLADILQLAAGIDLRTRGVNDMQGDLSMRGGTFDQMLVLINGINYTDAQTGHYTLDIPIDLSLVERVEILTPSMLLNYGIVAFCGAVNIVVGQTYRDCLLAQIGVGSDATLRASALAERTVGRWHHTVAAGYARSDGYMKNTDYRAGNLYMQSSRHDSVSDWHMHLGAQFKDYGSQGFYSISYPDQFESTRALTGSLSRLRHLANGQWENAIYGRLHSDRFELFREGAVEAPSWYGGHNYHLSDVAGMRSRLLIPLGGGVAMVGAELRHEGIVSSVLGEPSSEGFTRISSHYNHSASRLGLTAFGGYRTDWRNCAVAANLLGGYNGSFGPQLAASLEANYRINNNLKATMAFSRTYRLPTFTDLYYQSVNQCADPDLNSEHSLNAEARLLYRRHRLALQGTLFFRAGRNIIDWVRWPDEEMWYAKNHSRVDCAGTELEGRYSLGGVIDAVGFSYAYCGIRQDAGNMVSGSALDYLRHKLNANLTLAPLPRLRICIDVQYRQREGSFVNADGTVSDYGDVLLLNAAVTYKVRRAVLFLEGYNLTDRSYRDHGGVPQPGISVMGGIRFSWYRR